MKLEYSKINNRGNGILFPDTIESAIDSMRRLNRKEHLYDGVYTDNQARKFKWDNKRKEFMPC